MVHEDTVKARQHRAGALVAPSVEAVEKWQFNNAQAVQRVVKV